MRPNPKFRKLILPLAITAALVACGSDNKTATPTPTSVAGSSSKGIVIGGIVNAYPLTDIGTVDRTNKLAEPTTTADDGSYSLTLNSNYVSGTPVYVEITAVNGTLMRCDLTLCGTTAEFGETYPLADGFAMSATLDKAAGSSVAVNITPITDIASKLTLKKIVSGASPSAAAAASNAQVANRLGITGGLINQPIVDITSASSVNAATKAALEYNLKSAGAVAAMLKGDSTITLEKAMENFVTQFSDGGIADKEDNGSTAVTLEELLEEALALLEIVKKNPDVDQENSSVVASKEGMTADELNAETNGSTTASQGEVPADVGDDGLVATKAFVEQVRNLANAGVISDDQEAFADELDLASQAVSGDSDIVAEGLGMGLHAIVLAAEAYEDAADESKPTTHTDPDLDITVAISKSGETLSFSIDESITLMETSIAIDLNASTTSTITESDTEAGNTPEAGDTTYTETGDATATLSVSGSAASAAVSLSISEGSFAGSLNYNSESTESATGSSETWDDEATITGINAKLSVVLAQLTGDNKASFEGNMNLKIGKLRVTEDGEYSSGFDGQNYSDSEDYTQVVTIDGLEFSLSGKFSDTEGNSLSASLSASLDNAQETCTQTETEDNNSLISPSYSYSYNCDTNETASNFATVSLSIIFDLNIAGVDDEVNIKFNASRISLDDGKATIDLTYDGNQLNFAYPGGGSATLSNHNGVTMTLTETFTEGESSISGDIKEGGTSYAKVSDDSGAIVIRYNDGSFESFM
ncbi:MAG: hypothetical protein ACI9BO_000908 [Zhongshania sp.]|jgi:hypothetical protein